MPVENAATTGASAEENVVAGAIPTLDATVLEETATATTTVATEGSVETAMRGAVTDSVVTNVEADEEGAMEASAADVIGCVSKKKTLRPSTSRARLHRISPASQTSRRASVA
jgi:uncharacterized Rossmann fold enzyme